MRARPLSVRARFTPGSDPPLSLSGSGPGIAFLSPRSSARAVMSTTIHLEDEADRWRYTCPRGHRNWEPTNRHFFCQSCSRSHDDVDPAFDALLDAKTGEAIHRDELVLLTPVGPLDRSRRGEAA